MNLKLVALVAGATLLPLCAHAQTAADVQRVSKIIGADPVKKQAYCEIGKLGPQMDAAEQKKDNKKMEELGKKMDELGQKIGPEYAKVMEAVEKIDRNSAEGKRLTPAMQEMTRMCPR